MSCPATERLSAFADGDLSRFSAWRVRRHLFGCDRCRAELAELELTTAALPSLGTPEPPPADAGWAALTAKMARQPHLPPVVDRAPAPARRWFAWAMPVAAAAAMATLGVIFVRGRGPSDAEILSQADIEFRHAEEHYQRALAKLRAAADGHRADWPAERRQAYEQAQRALSDATAACRKATLGARDPDAEQLLFSAYRKEIAFYQDALAPGGRL